MKDEIKEILEDLKNKDISVDDLTHNDKVKLIDFITNLQEENRQIKLLKERYQLKKEVYKSRNEKAIGFIIEWCSISENTGKCICNLNKNKCTELLNILNGGDE